MADVKVPQLVVVTAPPKLSTKSAMPTPWVEGLMVKAPMPLVIAEMVTPDAGVAKARVLPEGFTILPIFNEFSAIVVHESLLLMTQFVPL